MTQDEQPTTTPTDEAVEDICVHCGVRILQVTLGELSMWVHVPSEGPVYLLVQCNLVASPQRIDAPTSAPPMDREKAFEAERLTFDGAPRFARALVDVHMTGFARGWDAHAAGAPVVDSAAPETKREEPAHVSGVGHMLCGPECPDRPPTQDPAPQEPVGPDCREGKHRACDGKAWRAVDDEIVDCACCARVHGEARARG